jgi:chaperonin cofactor prefoldin
MVTLESLDKKFDAIDRRFEKMDQKFDHMLELFDRRFNSLEKKFDEKIDDLAAITARGFSELRNELKGDLHSIENRLDTIEENSFT